MKIYSCPIKRFRHPCTNRNLRRVQTSEFDCNGTVCIAKDLESFVGLIGRRRTSAFGLSGVKREKYAYFRSSVPGRVKGGTVLVFPYSNNWTYLGGDRGGCSKFLRFQKYWDYSNSPQTKLLQGDSANSIANCYSSPLHSRISHAIVAAPLYS